jgi:hypothetical protein
VGFDDLAPLSTFAQMARVLRVSPTTVALWIERGVLPDGALVVFPSGGWKRLRTRVVRAWAEGGTRLEEAQEGTRA